MNCEKDQLAWVKIPKKFAKHGVEQLHNRVVRTSELVPDIATPNWYISPIQKIVVTGSVIDSRGIEAKPGETFEFVSLPDSWLVPLRGAPEPTAAGAMPVLEQTA